MSDTTKANSGSTEPISLILFAPAPGTETITSIRAWTQCLDSLHRGHDVSLIQETRPEVPFNAADVLPPDMPQTRAYTYDRAIGFRDAIAEAVHESRHPLVVFCTADNQYQPGDLQAMLTALDKEEEGIRADMVVGFRQGGQAPPWRVMLDMVSTLFFRVVVGVSIEPRRCWLGSQGWGRRLVARLVFGIRVLDPECRFVLVRRPLMARLRIQSNGPFFPVELLAKSNHLGCYLREEPVHWTPPSEPAHDENSFSQDALLVFQHPDFGPPPVRQVATE